MINMLANAGKGIFAISSYDTNYVLSKEDNLDKAISALTFMGRKFA